MERPTLEAMLEAAAGIEREGDHYETAEGYRVSLYVGEPGRGMQVSEVIRLELRDAYVEATSDEHHEVYYLEYSNLHGFSVKAPIGGAGRRTGFS